MACQGFCCRSVLSLARCYAEREPRQLTLMSELTMTQPGTIEHYTPYVLDLMNKFKWAPNPDDVVWHYTSGPSLLSILDSGTLYSTQVSCLNDATEIAYSAEKLRSALTELLPGLAPGSPAALFAARYVELLRHNPDSPSHAPIEYFVSCFSSLFDDLGQWRTYAGGEGGYALGFRVGSLVGIDYSLVAKVNYDPGDHETLAKEAAAATLKFYGEGPAGDLDWDNKFLATWDKSLSYLSPLFKDPGFAQEQEIRIVHELQESEYTQQKFLQKRSLLSRHLPLTFPISGPRLPLKEIMIGPCRHRRITQVTIGTILKARGYPEIPVTFSKLPYQDV